MRNNAFTLVELLIVIVIIGILVTIAIPQYQGMIIRSRIAAELYSTVDMIRKAEDIFYAENNFYAAAVDGVTGYDLWYSTTQAYINNFGTFLNIDIPGINSTFVYGVYYSIASNGSPTSIFIRVRGHFTDWGILCRVYLEGSERGQWSVMGTHPWSKYLNPPE